MWFKILYFLYLTLAFLFPTVMLVGGLSVRHVVMLIMLIICIVQGARWDKYMTLYTIFLVFFGISSAITGYLGEVVNMLLGSYLQVYAFYFATFILIKKYRAEKLLFYYLFAFGALDALVTIGQFYNLSIADNIFSFLGVTYEDNLASHLDRFDRMEGIALQGLLGSVRNGYFLSAIAIMSLYNDKGKITVFNIVFWLFFMTASLLDQERMGFFTAVMLSVVVFVFSMSHRMNRAGLIVGFVFILIALFLLPLGLETLQQGGLRYNVDSELRSERSYLASVGWRYFLSNPMGGFFEYVSLGHDYPHNVFVNMFLVGGMFGGVAIFMVFTKQLIELTKYLLYLLKKHQISFAAFWCFMFLAYTFNSLTHNLSIVLGTFEFFVFWSAFEALKERGNNIAISVN